MKITSFIVYDLETFNTNQAGSHCVSLCRLSRSAKKINRDQAKREYQKSEK